MTPLEHYRKAEALLRVADGARADEVTAQLIARAQVHATLATSYAANDEEDESKPAVHFGSP